MLSFSETLRIGQVYGNKIILYNKLYFICLKKTKFPYTILINIGYLYSCMISYMDGQFMHKYKSKLNNLEFQ